MRQSYGGLQPRDSKPSKRMRRSEGSGSDFILPSLGGSQNFERVKVTVPLRRP